MYTLIAQFPRQQICRDRQYSGLLRWSAYILALEIPTEKPTEQWVKERITAGRVTVNADMYVAQTISGVASVPDIQTNIRQHLSAFNDETTEASMDLQVDGALSATMPHFCAGAVTDAEVSRWYEDNGFPAESPAGVGAARP